MSSVVLVLLNGLLWALRTFVAGWRLWTALALAGALLLSACGLARPFRYRSEGNLAVTPRFLLEGYLLATQELTSHYAVRLEGDESIARAMRAAGTEIEPAVAAAGGSGMTIQLSVEHPDADAAERITSALMNNLRDEILAENRTRVESDRLDVELSLTTFARPATSPWWQYALAGTAAGFTLGTIMLFLGAWWRRGRLRTDSDARQLFDVPLIGIIPRP